MKIRDLTIGLPLLIATALVSNGCAGGNSVSGAVGTSTFIVSTSPAKNATGVSPSTAISATFNMSIDPSTLTSSTFTVSSPAGPIQGVVSYSNTNFTATFQPNAPLPMNTVITATLTTAIRPGASSTRPGHTALLTSNYSWSFTTSSSDIAPTVVSTTPTASATGVSLSTSVSVTFSEPMSAASINSGTFTLTAGGGPKVKKQIALGSTVSYSNGVATLSPTSPLAVNTVYTATVTTGVTDVAGTPMAANYSWTFTTSASDIAPLVLSSVPAQGATGTSISTQLSVTFNEAMNYSTITGTTFSVAPAGGSAISATVRYANNVATLEPTAALAPNTVYTATLTTAITDVDGTPLASNYQWTFTTATDIAPVVLTTTPEPNALGVSISSNLTVTFSESMHTSTINSTNLTLAAQGGASVPLTVYYSNNVAVMSPNNALTPGTTYTATVSGLVQDVANTPMGANYSWSFTAGVQDANPTVVSTNPPNGALGVALTAPITANFSESMNGSTITGTSFTLVPAGGTAVSATVTYANGMATLTPASPLLAGVTYTATLSTSIQDVDGTPLHNPYQWTFTAGAGPSRATLKRN